MVCYFGDVATRAIKISGQTPSQAWFFVTQPMWLEGFLDALVYLGKKKFFRKLRKHACCWKKEEKQVSDS